MFRTKKHLCNQDSTVCFVTLFTQGRLLGWYTACMRAGGYAVLAISILLCSAIPKARALSDIDLYPHKSSITLLQSRGIIDGYPDGTFRPYRSINRAEFLKLLMLAVFGNDQDLVGSTPCFTDFIGEEQWFWRYACTAKRIGIVHGHPDGTFRGEDTINLAEALKMTLEAWNVRLGPEIPGTAWYDRYMKAAAERGIFKRFPFTPGYLMTRGEMALLLVILDEPIAYVTGEPEPRSETKVVSVPLPTKPAVCGNGIREGTEQCDDGNLETGDGCSDICIIVAEPIHHGALRIEQQSISSSAIASGAKDVTLFAFTALAGRQDVYVTTLKFKSAAGSLQFAENYRLMIDRDGDGSVETVFGRATPDGETITFGNLNILVKDGYYTRVELWADIDTTLSASSIAVEFDTAEPDFVEGVDRIDGEDVTGIKLNSAKCQLQSICWVEVITLSTQTITIRTQGNLFVTESTSPLGSRQILASTQTPALLRLTFYADSEDVKVKELAVEGVPSSVESLKFTVAGSSSPFATGRSANCDTVTTGRFCTDSDFTVPQNGEKTIEVEAVLKSDNEGAVSGQSATLSLSAATSAPVAIEAEGFYSGQQLLSNDGDSSGEGEIFIGTETPQGNSAITSSTHTIVLARITSITNGNPDAEGSAITGGGMTFGQFTFHAANHENTNGGANSADINKLVFTVSAVNMEFEAGSFHLFNKDNSSVTSACTESATTGTITVTCDGLIASVVSTFISRGDSITLALHGTVANANSSPGVSILQASLQDLSDPNTTGTVEWTDGNTTFGWVDIGSTTVKSTGYRLD